MQARRPSPSSPSSPSLLPPPSSPPVAVQHFGDASSPSEARGSVSPAWTAPSPTRTLGHSSPELPALPSFSVLGNNPRTPSTVARNDRTDTSYYTASWGSPYRHPPPSFNRERQVSTTFGSDDFEEDSSILQFGLGHLLPSRLEIEEESPNQFNLEHLIPRLDQDASPNRFTLEHLIRSRLPNLQTPTKEPLPSGTTPRASDSNPTSEEWARQFLEVRWNRETNDWRSNSSGTDEASTQDQDILINSPSKRGHKVRNTNKTLNQQDFWRHFSKDQKEALGKMMASKYAVPEMVSHSRQTSRSGPPKLQDTNGHGTQVEKSQNQLPLESPTPMSGAPVKPAENVPKRPIPETLSRPAPETPSKSSLAPPELARAQSSRMRKKVMVKGKGCIISIPRDIPRGSPGYPPKPMTRDAVNAKLEQLEQDGYDTRGFSTGGLDPHNRAIWPAEADVRADRTNSNSQFRVHVSKLSEWKTYVDSLFEAKLAALGVSAGGEENIPLPLSRQASSQQYPNLPFSPPLPTSSAGSHRMARQGSIVSGSFPHGPSPGHMSRQSIASPAAFSNPRVSMHMHRHSTFASPANFVHHAMSPSGTWSPGGYFGSQDGRSGSPALTLSRPDLSGLVSPHSPFGMRSHQQFPITPSQKDDYLAQMHIQQQHLQAQLLQQQQQQILAIRPSSTLAEVPEDEDEEDELPAMKHATKTAPEIVVPTPRGHRHNISENLEREAASEEYHLEEAIDKQFAEGGDFSTEPESSLHFKPSGSVANSTWDDNQTVLHQPQPHSRAHSLAKSQQPATFSFPAQQNPRADSNGAQTSLSENTNPSLEDGEVRNTAQSSAQHSKAPSQVSNSWKDNKFAFSKPGSAIHSKHTSRSSVSKLNVEAKEFKFNPAASFNPGSFATGSTFSSATKSPADTSVSRSNKPSVDGVASFNVSAPAFKPDAPVFKPVAAPMEPKSVGTNGSPFPSSGFNFSSPPSFKPDAPVFNPKGPSLGSQKPVPGVTNFSSKIFGDVNISASDIVKPATRSKAVAIVRPDVTRQKTPEEPEEREDESGRPMQADGREKRARRDRSEGDDVPKFALQPSLASQPLAETKQAQSGKQETLLEQDDMPEDKGNLSSDGKSAKSRSKSPESLVQEHDAAIADPDVTLSELDMSADPAIDDNTPVASDPATPTIEAPPPSVGSHGHRSTLSANAKPFDFRPQIGSAGYDFGFHVTKPSHIQEPEKSHSSPSRYASRSPATTFRPSDDGSYKTALESGRHAPYPESESIDFDNLGDHSFNDIDAVMKQMEEQGSDFGVERDEHSWEQSSPQRTPLEFNRNDLRPVLNLRSDAPSPSPRRFQALRENPGSVTSVQNPFDDERAAIASPVHRLNNASDIPVSDWDEGLVSEGEDRIQMRSRFFDQHVDQLMGRLLETRLSPLERNLQGIQEALSLLSQRSGHSRRSRSANERLDSDADDEDDDIGTDSHYRNRSPRKDRRLEKIRSIVRDAFETHQSQNAPVSVPVSEPMAPEKIREIMADLLTTHQPSAVPAEQIRAIFEEAFLSNKPPAPEPISKSLEAEEIRSIFAETLASHASQSNEPVKTEDVRSIVMEAFISHAPQSISPPVPEHLLPDNLRTVFAEALASHERQMPAIEQLRPETIRSIVVEAVASQQLAIPKTPTAEPIPLDVMQTLLAEALASHKPTDQLQAKDVCELVDDAFRRQSMEITKREESQAILEKDARIAQLEGLLKEATVRTDAEVDARRNLESREVDTAHLLKVTEEELALLQQAAREDEDSVRALRDEREVTRRSLEAFQTNNDKIRDKLSLLETEVEDIKLEKIALESSEEDLRTRLKSVTAENDALSSTLEEHRLSATKWRSDIQEAHEESQTLRRVNEQARFQAEEAVRVRESMRTKFEKLQQDMVAATQQVAAERAQWLKSEEASLTKYEILSARIEAEGRTRERLETELERLEVQEREGMKLRIHLEQSQKQNVKLEETNDKLRQESQEHQKNAERYERDMREARDAAHVEIRRTRVLMEADIDAANNQVNIIRHELESENARVRAELDQVRLDADTAREKHELDLEAASDAKEQAIREASENKKHSLQEQQRVLERQLELIKQEHTRSLDFAFEDKERAASFHNDKLALADAKLDHFKDKIALLEEKLQVAKEAASAAAAAASKVSTTMPSGSASGPGKASSQALRESIAVLQEQLQEREARIESLEHDLADVDTESPAKLKERDTEINWLRELLGVRIDDLNDLINSLAQPTFDRETVRDAAIRIRTNLQMEQSEKERLISGGQQSFPTLSTLSNFASPKAVQLAAAFGNWRKGRGEAASALGAGSNTSSRNQTPSRAAPHSAQSFLSGLMTPPTSNMRRTPDLPTSSKRPPNMRSTSVSSHASTDAGFPSLSKQTHPVVPQTPPLMRKASYDQDAEIEPFSESGFYDDESIVDGELTPLALNFGRELPR